MYTHIYIYICTHAHIPCSICTVRAFTSTRLCVSLHHMICLFIYNKTHTHTTLQFGFPSAPTSSYAYAAYAYTHPQRITAHPEENTRHSLTHISSKTKTVYSD